MPGGSDHWGQQDCLFALASTSPLPEHTTLAGASNLSLHAGNRSPIDDGRLGSCFRLTSIAGILSLEAPAKGLRRHDAALVQRRQAWTWPHVLPSCILHSEFLGNTM